ncbi:hypothetical protein [Longimicrobium sp.]|uniref:hypothetical protein n=1 Tax=Longimicrobium sp. TaxID=2029185 RepID=UPI002E372CC0|nr:hypothetical protein [Longimicrobium sp.]HEX6038090.1 hypothetical protein [Longimicrobium sp.]
MKTFSRFRLLPLLALVLAAGCSDLGIDSGASEVTGLTIEDGSGNALVTVNASGSVNGTLTVPRNQTRSLRVVLRGPGGTVTPGITESIRVTTTNSVVAQWTETGEGTGTLRGGTAAGTTNLRVDLISAGATAYTSPAITVQVT